MGDLFGDYEKQFGILSADITAKIGKVPNLSGGKLSFLIIIQFHFDMFLL